MSTADAVEVVAQAIHDARCICAWIRMVDEPAPPDCRAPDAVVIAERSVTDLLATGGIERSWGCSAGHVHRTSEDARACPCRVYLTQRRRVVVTSAWENQQ